MIAGTVGMRTRGRSLTCVGSCALMRVAVAIAAGPQNREFGESGLGCSFDGCCARRARGGVRIAPGLGLKL
jgi:hypothetical protein